MDARHFDTLVRSLSERGSRRGLLGILAGFPIAGGLAAFLDDEAADAKGQRKRHKKPHHHRKHTGNRAGKQKKRRCQPESRARTCAGTCGPVKNNCTKTVDCGSCACDPPCDVCFTCQEGPNTPGACVVDPQQVGTACGDAVCTSGEATPAPTCDSSGDCVPGTPLSCAPYVHCAGEVCATTCQDDDDCVTEAHCNGASHCVGDRLNGEPCAHGGQCQSGDCVDDVCCANAACAQCHACNVPGQAGSCAPQPNGTTCNDDDLCTTNDVCTAGLCGGTPVVCNACQLPDTCDPDTGECQPDPAKRHTCDGPCPSGQWCDAGACAAIQDTVTLPECGSRCTEGTDLATAVICGQSVTCPSCDSCRAQTGCLTFRFIPDGPEGPDNYCASTAFGGGQTCTTNANCPSDHYCADFTDDLCVAVCPV